MSTPPARTHLHAAAAAVALLLLTGCTPGASEDPTPSTTAITSPAPTASTAAPAPGGATVEAPTPEPSAEPTQTQTLTPGTPTDTAPPALSDLDPAISQAAIAYLDVRENAASHFHANPSDWLTLAQPLMTAEGFAAMAPQYQDGTPGNVWTVSHDNGLAVQVVSDCSLQEQAGVNTDVAKMVQCTVNDRVLGADGAPLATTAIPDTWPYVGVQDPALLLMERVGDTWLVAADYTGQAS